MNISTDKLTNETNQLTYKIHLILLKNKDTLVLNHYVNLELSIWMRFSSSVARSLT